MAVVGSKRILALKKRKAREREGAFLIEGIRLCEEALKVEGATEQTQRRSDAPLPFDPGPFSTDQRGAESSAACGSKPRSGSKGTPRAA